MERTHTPTEKALAAALFAFLAEFNDYDGRTHRRARAALRGASFPVAAPQDGPAYSAPVMTRAEFAELLAARIPGLGTDEQMEGGDTVAALCELFAELRAGVADLTAGHQAGTPNQSLAALLLSHFPWLGTGDDFNLDDALTRLATLYATLSAGANFEHPVQMAADAYLADGGTASGLCELLAEVAEYSGPQTRPDDTDLEGEYDELADELRASAGRLKVVYG